MPGLVRGTPVGVVRAALARTRLLVTRRPKILGAAALVLGALLYLALLTAFAAGSVLRAVAAGAKNEQPVLVALAVALGHRTGRGDLARRPAD